MNNYKNNERTVNQMDKNLRTKSSTSSYTVVDTKIDRNSCNSKALTIDQNAKWSNTKISDSASKYASNHKIDEHQDYDGSLLVALHANKIDEY